MMSIKTLWADDIARGQWDTAGNQFAMPWKLKWQVWYVRATQVESSEAV